MPVKFVPQSSGFRLQLVSRADIVRYRSEASVLEYDTVLALFPDGIGDGHDRGVANAVLLKIGFLEHVWRFVGNPASRSSNCSR